MKTSIIKCNELTFVVIPKIISWEINEYENSKWQVLLILDSGIVHMKVESKLSAIKLSNAIAKYVDNFYDC